MLAAVVVLVAEFSGWRRQRLSWCCSLLARPPPGILRLAVPAPLPLPGVRRPRTLLRALLLEVPRSAFLLQQLVQAMGVVPPRHRQPHSGPHQELPQVPHELTDPGLSEELLRVIRVDPPVDGEGGRPSPCPAGNRGPSGPGRSGPVWQPRPGHSPW
jgi:hypothetical protein